VLRRVERVRLAVSTSTERLPGALELVDRLATHNQITLALAHLLRDEPRSVARELLGSDAQFESAGFRRQFPVVAAIGAPHRDKRMRAVGVADLLACVCALAAFRDLGADLVQRLSSAALSIRDWTPTGQALARAIESSIGMLLDGAAGAPPRSSASTPHGPVHPAVAAGIDTLRTALAQLRHSQTIDRGSNVPCAEDSAGVARIAHPDTTGSRPAKRLDRIGRGLGLARLVPRQRLHTSRSALTSIERRALVEQALIDARSPDPRIRSTATLAALVIAAGQTPDACARMRLSPDAEADFVSVDGGYISRYLPRPERAFTPTKEQASLLEDHADRIALCLPVAVCQTLRDAIATAPGPSCVGDALGLPPATANQAVAQWLARVKARPRRLTVARLTHLLPRELLAGTRGDLVKVLLLTDPAPASASGFLPRAAYYAAYPLDELAGDHRAALVRLIGRDSVTAVFPHDAQRWAGAHLRIRQQILRSALDALNAGFVQRREEGDFVAAHNHLTAALLWQLHLVTGARPVRDPFARREDLDADNARVFLADKLDARAPAGRWVPITEPIVRQVRAYWAHLRDLCDRLKTLCPSTASSVASLLNGSEDQRAPVFFFLGRRGRLLQVRPGRLIAYLGPLASLPVNQLRADTASRLLAANCQFDLVDAWLGHRHFGEALSMTSMLSARDLCNAVRPHLPTPEALPIADEQSGRDSVPALPDRIVTTGVGVGASGRAERAARRLLALRADVRAVLAAERQANSRRHLSAERVRLLAEQLTQRHDADEVRGRAARALLLDALARLSRRGWKVDGLPPLRHSLVPPPFPAGSPRTRAFVAGARARFVALLGDWHGGKPTWRPARRTAEILLSATLFGGRTDPRALHSLLSAIRSGQLFARDGVLLVEPGPTPDCPDQRQLVDPVTAALIAGAHARHVPGAALPSAAQLRAVYDDDVDHCLRALLGQLGAAPPRGVRALDWWCNIAKDYWRVEMAGSSWATAEGILRPQSVSTAALVRALDGVRCAPLKGDRGEVATPARVTAPAGVPSPTLESALAWVEVLRSLIYGAATLHAGTAAADERTRRDELVRALSHFGRGTAPSQIGTTSADRVVTMLAGWILDRARRGGLRTEAHRVASLYGYFTRVGASVVELAWSSDPTILDRDDFETLYGTVMDRAPPRSARGWLSALKSLHESWMRLYRVPAVCWQTVAAECALSADDERLPIVNWITYAEYRLAWQLLISR
jgi:hypothetical protein